MRTKTGKNRLTLKSIDHHFHRDNRQHKHPHLAVDLHPLKNLQAKRRERSTKIHIIQNLTHRKKHSPDSGTTKKQLYGFFSDEIWSVLS